MGGQRAAGLRHFDEWEKTQQLGYEPLHYKNGMFYINGPTWTEQTIEYWGQ
jgi:xylan 1,4-beta-xylosidase